MFAAAPGHPALRDLCDHIALHAFGEFSGNTNRDTLERTGPGVWTDIILKHAYMHPPAKVGRELLVQLSVTWPWVPDCVCSCTGPQLRPAKVGSCSVAGSYLPHICSLLPTRAPVTHDLWGHAQMVQHRDMSSEGCTTTAPDGRMTREMIGWLPVQECFIILRRCMHLTGQWRPLQQCWSGWLCVQGGEVAQGAGCTSQGCRWRLTLLPFSAVTPEALAAAARDLFRLRLLSGSLAPYAQAVGGSATP